MRIDKFVWTVRLYKTRSIAAEAVKAGEVLLDEKQIKPAQAIKAGEILRIKRNPIWRSFKILGIPKNRIGAKLLSEFLEECTSPAELEKLEMMRLMPGFDREKGAGRPTKKDRRDLDSFGWED
jgi:ribosome-associated heat shock protein Hsp15